ncbi:MAG: GNAT family N-acetyltransferase [Actinomycetota bacterium]
MLHTTTFEREEDLPGLLHEWDGLAVGLGLPYGGPAWMLAWWRHLASPGAHLRVFAVRDGDELVGLGAFHLVRETAGTWHGRLLAARYGGTPLGPLAAAGREREVAAAIAGGLAEARPRLHAVHLDGVPASSRWPQALRRGWPGGAVLQREARRPLPTIEMTGLSFEEWMAAKSTNFRQTLRRRRRQLEAEGAVVRLSASVGEAHADLAAFERLHESRWEWRGGSGRLRPATQAFLADLAEELLPSGRFRLWSVDLGGETISSHLFICAGGRAGYWLGGFDDRFARYSPAMVTLLAAIEHAWASGDTSVGLGAGRQGYKARFTDHAEDLDWVRLVPARAAASPRTWVGVAPSFVADGVRNRVPASAKAWLKSRAASGSGEGRS